MKESAFSKSFCASLRKKGVDVQRIESSTGLGIPDVNCCLKGKEFWIELKSNHHPISKEQFAWGCRRALAGGHVFVVRHREKIRGETKPLILVSKYVANAHGLQCSLVCYDPWRLTSYDNLAYNFMLHHLSDL